MRRRSTDLEFPQYRLLIGYRRVPESVQVDLSALSPTILLESYCAEPTMLRNTIVTTDHGAAKL